MVAHFDGLTRRAWLSAPAALLWREGVEISAAIPAGNVLVESIAGGTARIRQDLRDTEGDWFWWCFEVSGAGPGTLRFEFTGSDVIGTRGPAVSTDGGLNWRWLGREAVEGKSITYEFGPMAPRTRFAFAMPYTEAELLRFLRGRSAIRVEEQCRTNRGRTTERLRFGSGAKAARKVLLTARHHACECMASYSLEGLMEAALEDRWLRANADFAVIPFMDKDGVEEGDQGKNRRPRDHNRDYDGESVHASVRANREWVPQWSDGSLAFALDLHCPHIRGENNEHIYFVGSPDGGIAKEMDTYSRILERLNRGPLPYRAAGNIAFGTAWNKSSNYAQGASFAHWVRGIPGIRMGGTIEIPYANCGAVDVTQTTARAFGHALAAALREYLRR